MMFRKEPVFVKRRICMLIITHACNLNCLYCYEKHKSDNQMSFETAKEIIEKEIKFVQSNDDFDELEIDFFGGEPFLNYDLMVSIVEWLETYCTIPFICFANSNGTILNDERKEWLTEHYKSIVVGISYDGCQAVQRLTRGTTVNQIDLSFFRELWPEEPFHMTVSKDSLRYFAESVIDAHNKNYKLTVGLAQGEEWTNQDANDYYDQLSRLSDFYIFNHEIVPINIFSRQVIIDDAKLLVQEKFCGAGKQMVAYDYDGNKYPCQMFTPLVVGPDSINIYDLDHSDAFCDSFCKECILKAWCSTCAGFNFLINGNTAIRDKHRCKMMFAEAYAVCKFQTTYYSEICNNWDDQDANYVASVIKAYEVLSRTRTWKPQERGAYYVD